MTFISRRIRLSSPSVTWPQASLHRSRDDRLVRLSGCVWRRVPVMHRGDRIEAYDAAAQKKIHMTPMPGRDAT
ncbi:TPA: hypothetical protein ACUNF5_005528 [Burkholderia orbicola]|uniref:hypothetical protein n=1 Tax=Burkholderia cepacia complex TaxID=87882 RepID=UPI000F5979A2|nr:hypothetical protein [Burkholderia cenocepacia]MBR7952622.1 hypothetical protein [Burkholderia cenocepacia]MBR8111121.1 hypothetical protein [Burkholderia cenocepacia]